MSKIHFIGNAHLDPVWLWRWNEGLSEVLATFKSALDRMEEFPDFKFTSACASYYQIVEKIDPEMFNKIQQRVKEGRWNIVGGWFLQPDCNIPDGESFIRHALISQRYFKEKFGVTAKTGYNVDSFGHNAALPKILKASGIDNYTFLRPSQEEQGRRECLFNWESDDGSSVKAQRIPYMYNCIDKEHFDGAFKIIEEEGRDMMLFYGVGNHGGGPTIALIEEIKNMDIDKCLSTPDEFFATVDKDSLPTIKDELQHHARGAYSTVTAVKKANRRAEGNLVMAEKLSLMAKELTGFKYPEKKFKKAWQNLLFNQFHDILCGCCIKSAYDDANHLFGETMSITEQAAYFAMQKIAWQIDTLGDGELTYLVKRNFKNWEHDKLGIPVFVFNTHEWTVRTLVTVSEVATRVTDSEGNEIPFQLVRAEQTNGDWDKTCTAFIAEIPALGYNTYRLYTKTPEEKKINPLSVSETVLENEKLRLELDKEYGDVIRLVNKESGKTVIDGKCRAILLDETDCDTWAHNRVSLGEFAGEFKGAELLILESGPVRATVRSIAKYGDSTIIRDFSILAGDDRVTVKTTVDFHEKHRTLKFAFPMTDDTVVARIPFGTIKRTGYTGEEPAGCFISSGSLAVANDSKYAYDAEDGEFRMTVLRGAIFADHYGVRDDLCEFMDQGITEFSYSLYEYKTPSDGEKRARELNVAPRVLMGSFHKGNLPQKMSCIETDSDSITFSAIKKAEGEDGAIIRCYDMDGDEINAKVTLFGKTVDVKIPPYSVRTYTEAGEEILATEIKD